MNPHFLRLLLATQQRIEKTIIYHTFSGFVGGVLEIHSHVAPPGKLGRFVGVKCPVYFPTTGGYHLPKMGWSNSEYIPIPIISPLYPTIFEGETTIFDGEINFLMVKPAFSMVKAFEHIPISECSYFQDPHLLISPRHHSAHDEDRVASATKSWGCRGLGSQGLP